MRRIGRWVLNAITALSLLLCMATAGLWVRSYRYCDELRLAAPLRQYAAMSWNGVLAIKVNSVDAPPIGLSFRPYGWAYGHRHEPLAFGDALYPRLRDGGMRLFVEYDSNFLGTAAHFYKAIVAFWLVTAVLGILPLGRAAAWLRRSRRMAKRGRCPSCLYDLTGNLSGVCPECGTKIASASPDPLPMRN